MAVKRNLLVETYSRIFEREGFKDKAIRLILQIPMLNLSISKNEQTAAPVGFIQDCLLHSEGDSPKRD